MQFNLFFHFDLLDLFFSQCGLFDHLNELGRLVGCNGVVEEIGVEITSVSVFGEYVGDEVMTSSKETDYG